MKEKVPYVGAGIFIIRKVPSVERLTIVPLNGNRIQQKLVLK